MVESNNIDREISTVWVTIYGKQRKGKTLLAIIMAYENWKNRIYSNVNIFENWKQLNHKISSILDVTSIGFSWTPGVVVIDEWGINASSRKSMSSTNEIMTNLLVYIGKINCSLIWITQRYEMLDVNIRTLSSDLILECHKSSRGEGKPPIFFIHKKRNRKGQLILDTKYRIDLIEKLKWYNLTYNTLDRSKLKSLPLAEARKNKKLENK